MARTLIDASLIAPFSTTFIGMGRNRIINGEMMIDQANGGNAVTQDIAGAKYGVDQFLSGGQATSGVFTVQRNIASPPPGFTHFIRATCTTADTSIISTDLYSIINYVEGSTIRDFQMGSSGAVTFTLSFYVRSSLTGIYTGVLVNNASNRFYPFEYTINSANTWERKSITLIGDTTGTWAADTNIGIRIRWNFAVGSGYQGTAGAWTGTGTPFGTANQVNWMSSVTSRTWDMTGVQLEIGSVATVFERRPLGLELSLCQRYLQVFGNTVGFQLTGGQVQVTTQANISIPLLAPMRVTPTLTVNNPTNWQFTNAAGGALNITALSGSVPAGSNLMILGGNVASGLVVGNCTTLYANNSNCSIVLDARL